MKFSTVRIAAKGISVRTTSISTAILVKVRHMEYLLPVKKGKKKIIRESWNMLKVFSQKNGLW